MRVAGSADGAAGAGQPLRAVAVLCGINDAIGRFSSLHFVPGAPTSTFFFLKRTRADGLFYILNNFAAKFHDGTAAWETLQRRCQNLSGGTAAGAAPGGGAAGGPPSGGGAAADAAPGGPPTGDGPSTSAAARGGGETFGFPFARGGGETFGFSFARLVLHLSEFSFAPRVARSSATNPLLAFALANESASWSSAAKDGQALRALVPALVAITPEALLLLRSEEFCVGQGKKPSRLFCLDPSLRGNAEAGNVDGMTPEDAAGAEKTVMKEGAKLSFDNAAAARAAAAAACSRAPFVGTRRPLLPRPAPSAADLEPHGRSFPPALSICNFAKKGSDIANMATVYPTGLTASCEVGSGGGTLSFHDCSFTHPTPTGKGNHGVQATAVKAVAVFSSAPFAVHDGYGLREFIRVDSDTSCLLTTDYEVDRGDAAAAAAAAVCNFGASDEEAAAAVAASFTSVPRPSVLNIAIYLSPSASWKEQRAVVKSATVLAKVVAAACGGKVLVFISGDWNRLSDEIVRFFPRRGDVRAREAKGPAAHGQWERATIASPPFSPIFPLFCLESSPKDLTSLFQPLPLPSL